MLNANANPMYACFHRADVVDVDSRHLEIQYDDSQYSQL